jgi:hypothetical protein
MNRWTSWVTSWTGVAITPEAQPRLKVKGKNKADAWSSSFALSRFLWYNLLALMPARHQAHALPTEGTE